MSFLIIGVPCMFQAEINSKRAGATLGVEEGFASKYVQIDVFGPRTILFPNRKSCGRERVVETSAQEI